MAGAMRRWLALLAALLFVVGVHCAAENAQQAEWESMALQSPNGVVRLHRRTFDDLTKGERNYSASVLLTATHGGIDCGPCREFEPNYALVAKSWRRMENHERHIFAKVEFAEAREIFAELKLETAPTLFFYEPNQGPGAPPPIKRARQPAQFDFNRNMFGAEPCAKWLSQMIAPDGRETIKIVKPTDWTKIGVTMLAGLFALVAGRLAWPYIGSFVASKQVWALGTVVFVIVFTSGHMWNQIRKPPYSVMQQGHMQYIAAGFQTQYAVESQIVSIIYGVLGFSIIALASFVPKMEDGQYQRINVYIWSAMLFGMFNVLLGIFHIKNSGYPFRLLL